MRPPPPWESGGLPGEGEPQLGSKEWEASSLLLLVC